MACHRYAIRRMKTPTGHFSCPNIVFADRLPPKPRLLLIWLYSQRLAGGQCDPGYHAMQIAIEASRSTVKRSLNLLKKHGWLYNFRKQGPKNMRFWLHIPKHLVPSAISTPPQIVPFVDESTAF